MTTLSFHGAAETVTGSKYLLESRGARVLIDCGLFQGLKQLRLMNWDRLPFDPQSLDAVVLTHAHIDHTGYLPRLMKFGYRGPIYCSPATRKLTELLLLDSAKNQKRDANYANRRGFSKHHPAEPLYDVGDARLAIKHLKSVPRGAWHEAAAPIFTRFQDAGHLLGSTSIEVEVRDADPPLRLLFSGDVGRYDAPLYYDPAPPPACDYLICESTYGDRDHPPGDVLDQLADVVQRGVKRGGVMLLASFSVGRAQQLTYLLRVLIDQRRIPAMPIFIDSPMAVDATEIYCSFGGDHDLSEGELTGPQCVLDGADVQRVRTVAASKKLNHLAGPAVIISSAGMMTGGRILHHLRQRLPDPRNTILLGGFMAAGTRGRSLQEGAKTLRIHGRDVPVGAAIEQLTGLSGHAGRSELLRWLEPLPPPRCVFLTHGELESSQALAATLRDSRHWEVVIPRLGQSYRLGDSAELVREEEPS